MWKTISRFRTLLIIIPLLVFYCLVLLRNLDEGSLRSLQLRDDTSSADHIFVSVLVTAVNPATQELTAQISLRPQGTMAQDKVTPAVDLKLLVNNVRGQQEFDFPKGRRMDRIEAVFPLNGQVNKYPFDRYSTTLRLLMITNARTAELQVPKIPANTNEEIPGGGQLIVSATSLQKRTTVPLTINFSASTPGIKFEGNVGRANTLKVTGIELKMRRSNILIDVSIFVMTLMSALSMSLLATVLKEMASNRRPNVFVIGTTISLIFGLPALRNVQPGVPAVGALGDFVSFIWAEIVVGLSAIIAIWTWLLRYEQNDIP
jgi:hypothetical protein